MGDRRGIYRILVGKLELKRPGVERSIILKWGLKE
jgi:hypothetical protein